jgi:membrane peptidoglycan carboxypeptidase
MTLHKLRVVTLALSLAGIVVLAGALWWIVALGPVPLGKDLEFSTRVLDRNGRLLRAYATSDGRWRLPATPADVDPRFFDVLFAYEDKRFRAHHGVDVLALTRAAFQLAANGRILSGGSTLTMQVARLLEPRSARTLPAKLRQIVRAVEIERVLTKDEVLSLYLSIAPYGGNIEGIRSASLAYFGKEPRHDACASGAAGRLTAIAGAAAAGPLGRNRARGARPGARPLRRNRRGACRRNCARQSRTGARRALCHADAGATCRRRGNCAVSDRARISPHDRL